MITIKQNLRNALNNSPRQTCRAARLGLILTLALPIPNLILTSPAHAALRGSITLRHNALTNDRSIKLKDIANLEGKGAYALADAEIARLKPDQTKQTVSMTHVRMVLRQRQLNWSRLTLTGHTQCRVIRVKAQTSPQNGTRPSVPNVEVAQIRNNVDTQESEQQISPARGSKKTKLHTLNVADGVSAAQSNRHEPLSINYPTTLKALIVKRLSQLANKSPDELDISFRQRQSKRLQQDLAGKRFELEPHSSDGYGRIPVRVRRYEGVDITERFTITANVRRLVLATVACARIDRGERITADDLEVRQIALEPDQTPVITDKDSIIGLVAASTLRKGRPIETGDVQSPILVERGERITIGCLSGNLVVRTVGRARDDGARGDRITVRNLVSGETFQAIVTGRSEAAVKSTKETPKRSLTPVSIKPRQNSES